MNSSLKPLPLIAEVLPGYTVLGIVAVSYFTAHQDQWQKLISSQSLLAVVAGLGAASFVAAWIVGTALDSVRDLLEELLDLKWEVGWDFLFKASEADIRKLDESWLAYYFLNGNYVVGLLVIFALMFIGLVHLPPLWTAIIAVVFVVSGVNAGFLRSHIRKLILDYNRSHSGFEGPPHEGVYTRLGRSRVHPDGVGVFAIRPIPKDTLPFETDDSVPVWIEEKSMQSLPPPIKKLYEDFGVLKEGKWCVPTSFNKLTPAWYLNCSTDNPNMACNDELEFYSMRDIKEGEELTVDYRTYSEYTMGCEK